MSSGKPIVELDLLRMFSSGTISFVNDAGHLTHISSKELASVEVVYGPGERGGNISGENGRFELGFVPEYDENAFKCTFLKYDVTCREAKYVIGSLVRFLCQKCIVQDAYLLWRARHKPLVGGTGQYASEIVCEVATHNIGKGNVPGPAAVIIDEPAQDGKDRTVCYLRYVRRFVLKSALHSHHPLKGQRIDGRQVVRKYLEEDLGQNPV